VYASTGQSCAAAADTPSQANRSTISTRRQARAEAKPASAPASTAEMDAAERAKCAARRLDVAHAAARRLSSLPGSKYSGYSG
jgi:hypothetical protein